MTQLYAKESKEINCQLFLRRDVGKVDILEVQTVYRIIAVFLFRARLTSSKRKVTTIPDSDGIFSRRRGCKIDIPDRYRTVQPAQEETI